MSARAQVDRGMTLPELLIAITVLGLIVTVLASAIVVTLRQDRSTEGRFNVARAEQNIGMWLPGDLASAAAVTTDPLAMPCGRRHDATNATPATDPEPDWVITGESCPDLGLPAGSNALLLGWSVTETDDAVTGTKTYTYTNVSYYFYRSSTGSYELARIECESGGSGWSCHSWVLLKDLPEPSGTWMPGDPVPSNVIVVSQPLAAAAIDESQTVIGDENFKNARRVIVTVNGGGSSDGAGGAINQISITAGGTYRNEIAGTSMQGAPSFVEARSKCGGPLVLVVDESNSIGSAIDDVKTAVTSFVDALAGTPVQLEIVGFHTYSHVLGAAPNEWHRYFNMADQADVDALRSAVSSLQGHWSSGSNGGTNWEEALFRTLYNADGSTPQVSPKTIVFFTDGVPTFDRLTYRTSPGVAAGEPDPGPKWFDSNGSLYSQVAFDRADDIARQARAWIRFVGVAVGLNIFDESVYVSNEGNGYQYPGYERATTWRTYEARYWVRPSGSTDVPASYAAVKKSTYDNASSSRRKNQWNYNGGITSAQFDSLNSTSDESDGVRRSGPGGWVTITQSEYNGRPSKSADAYRANVVTYPAPAVTESVQNAKIIGRLMTGGDNYDEAIWDGTKYTNVETADLYTSTDFGQLPAALKAIALGECGGTLTMQTRVDGAGATDPFSYQNSQQFDAAGVGLPIINPEVVTTNRQFTTGTFDFDISDGLYRDVVVVPNNYSDLGIYRPEGWSCRAGNTDRAYTLVDVPGADPWKGIRVRVGANEAVSCIQTVSRLTGGGG